MKNVFTKLVLTFLSLKLVFNSDKDHEVFDECISFRRFKKENLIENQYSMGSFLIKNFQ